MSKNNDDFRMTTVPKSAHLMIPKELYEGLKVKAGENFIYTASEISQDGLNVKIKRITAADLAKLR